MFYDKRDKMENNIIANIKSLGIDMINKAGSGHPGIVLSAATIMYTLYAKHMNVNPRDTNWINRDRFIMSAGHGSALLYSTLYMAGFISLGDLKNFRMLDSRTPGHPEYGVTPGVEMSTGPLGQGFASAVGFAIAEKKLKSEYPELIDYYTYVLCSDGDLMEGISYEAASLAGHLKLDNLIVLYDSNNISLDGNINYTFTENVRERFESLGWYTILVKNNRVSDIDRAINKAKKIGLPTLIEVKTILGEGTSLENTNKVHGKPLSKEDVLNLKEKLNINNECFYVNEEAVKEFRKQISDRTEIKYRNWTKKYNEYVLENNNLLEKFINKDYEFDITVNDFDIYKKEQVRDANYRIMNLIANKTNILFGGSSDLSSSCKTYLDGKGDFSNFNYNGQNIWFGVREHSMGAILNGLALSGFMPFGSTFLVFSDYVKPAIRMSALMDLPVTYVFTHDSITVGEDGPTHEPIEQLSNLRAIPNLTVYRPADAKEVLGCWKCIFERKKPSSLIISRNETYTLEGTDPEKVKFGAYVILKEKEKLDAILLASGSEVEVALMAALQLNKEGKNIRVVSMPSLELFKAMDLRYKNEVLPVGKKVIVIEAGCSHELRDLVSNGKYLITLNEFGYSGKREHVLQKMNFNINQIIDRIRKLL